MSLTDESGAGAAPEDRKPTKDVSDADDPQKDAPAEGAESGAEPDEGEGQVPEPGSEDTGQKGEDEGDGPESEPEKTGQSWAARRRQRDRERIEALEEENQRLKSDKARIVRAGEKNAPPRAEDFDDDVEFAAAKAVFKSSEAQRQRELEDIDEREKENSARLLEQRKQAFAEQLPDARQRYRDFDAVASSAVPIIENAPDLNLAILDSDMGAEITYYLGKNPAKAREIAAMTPARMWKAIGALETRLTRPKSAPKRTVPEPREPARGGADGRPRSAAEARSFKEFERMRREEIKRSSV